MPRERRNQPASSTASRPLTSVLAHSTTPNELLPHLHQHALDVTGGSCSLLFQHNPRTGGLQATSGFGLETLRSDPWIPGVDETALVADAFARRMPTLVADTTRHAPDLAARIDRGAALLLPLVRRGERLGMLVVGYDHPPPAGDVGDAGEAADAFMAALELVHLRQADQLQHDVRELLGEFTATLSATLTLAAGLDVFCHGANRLFAADRTSVWIHDRGVRQLVLHASSDPADVARGARVGADDPSAPAAVAMRRARAEIVTAEDEATGMVTVPLRGCRRALGTVVFEGVRVETGGEIDLLDRADELGSQLSSAIENLQLMEDVMRSRREPPQTQLEAEREELRKRLTQSEKLAALGQFVAGIAHELNNPLQGVLGHLELLRTTGAFPKRLRREVQVIYREADRAAKIVRNLLVFAGSRRLTLRSVSLNVVLQKVLALRTAAHRAAGIEVVRHYDEKLPRVKSDPLLLHQVFLNMVMNAEHAIAATGRDSGRIEISTSVVPGGDRIVATLRDTGIGIPEDTLSRIFEPFYTTKEVGKGTGLGLAITYGIVQEHGGHIVAANHPDGGAVFTVELPIAPSPGR